MLGYELAMPQREKVCIRAFYLKNTAGAGIVAAKLVTLSA